MQRHAYLGTTPPGTVRSVPAIARWITLLILPLLLAACAGKQESDAFLGKWDPVKDDPSTPHFTITKAGQTYLVSDGNGEKYPGTFDPEKHVLNVEMAPFGNVAFSYISSTDRLLALGDEFRRAAGNTDPPASNGSPDTAAIAFGKSLFQSRMVDCGGRLFTHLTTNGGSDLTYLAELKNPTFVVLMGNEADAGDKLNGIDWKGTVQLRFEAYKLFVRGKWTEWYGNVADRMDLSLSGYENLNIVHKGGRWKHDDSNNGALALRDFLGFPAKPMKCDAIPKT